jgi:hypothetical protein
MKNPKRAQHGRKIRYIYAFAADESWEVEEFLDAEPTTGDYLLVSVPATAGQTFYVEV